MKKILLLVAMVIIASASITQVYALPSLENFLKPNQPFPFDVKMKILSAFIAPSGKDGDGSYYFVYGIDTKGNERIIEIQTNAGSMIGNAGNLKDVNRDFNYARALTKIGQIVTFECNGFDNIDAIEEYPQCYKIKKEPRKS